MDFSRPGAAEGVFPEEFDGAQRLGGGLAGDLFVALEMNEILAELFDGDQVRGFVIELTELADASEVSVLGPGLDADQFEVIGERNKGGVRGTFFICIGALIGVNILIAGSAVCRPAVEKSGQTPTTIKDYEPCEAR